MWRSFVVRRWQTTCLPCQQTLPPTRRLTTAVQQQDEPLRILFCGSEAFSITALEALHEYQKSSGGRILSIDVATRKDKAGGRGMKEMRSPQIKRAAARLGLRVHQFDTFTGWHLPEYGNSPQPYINLVVAVSFGLLVPPRILKSAKFGGLNVHPSMLPDLRGAAPINWSILKGDTHTGVTVQTLHPSKFDHGVILAQTPKPGLAIPEPDKITSHELRLLLAPIGAGMLVEAIRNKLYQQPYQEVRSNTTDKSHLLASKIVPSMKILDPFNDTLIYTLRKNRAMPKLWAEVNVSTEKGEQVKRIIFSTSLRAATSEDLPRTETQDIVEAMPIGILFAIIPSAEDVHQSNAPLYMKVKGGSVIAVPELLVAGGRESPAAAAAAHAKLFADPVPEGQFRVYRFQRPINVI